MTPQPSHAQLAEVLDLLKEQLIGLKSDVRLLREELQREVQELRDEVKPVCDAYKAGTIGARVLKWSVGVLASIAAIYTFVTHLPKE